MNTPLSLPFILASASPRRADLLRQLGIAFHIVPSHFDEPPARVGEDLLVWAQHAALAKARASAAQLPPDPALVLGADTVVVAPYHGAGPSLHQQTVCVLGKPRDAGDACAMLRMLSGREHVVLSAFALVTHPAGHAHTEVVETRVRFRSLSAAEIAEYLATGEPLDKAGAYGIQGRGAVLVEEIVGDYYTVVGLPLTRLWQALAPYRRG